MVAIKTGQQKDKRLKQIGYFDAKEAKDGSVFLEGFIQMRKGGAKNYCVIVKNEGRAYNKEPLYIAYRSRKRDLRE